MGYNNECFGIFAGGGVRGSAYIGALKALDELQINFIGYAGTSVGAIVASLVSVGYSYSELQELMFTMNYQQFKDLYLPFKKDFGFFKGDGVYNWLKNNIENKFFQNNPDVFPKNSVTFRDIKKDLIIIATDISNGTFKEYSRVKTPDVEVAHAVRASCSIPGFFKPVWECETCLIDGDVINNFPIWKNSSEVIKNTNAKVLEFRLEGTEKPKEITGFLDYFSAILEATYNISTDILEEFNGKNHQFEIIRIDAGKTKIIDFGISNDEKEELVKSGYNSVVKYFNYNLTEKNKNISKIYNKIIFQLEILKELVAKNKAVEALAALSFLSIYFTENKDYIHKAVYGSLLEFQHSFQDNMYMLKFLKLNLLRNKKEMTSSIEKIILNLQEYS